MALQKTKTFSDWSTWDYWNFSFNAYNELEANMRSDLHLYKDEATYNIEWSKPLSVNWAQFNYNWFDLDLTPIWELSSDPLKTTWGNMKDFWCADILAKAILENSKPAEERDENLAWFYDAVIV